MELVGEEGAYGTQATDEDVAGREVPWGEHSKCGCLVEINGKLWNLVVEYGVSRLVLIMSLHAKGLSGSFLLI